MVMRKVIPGLPELDLDNLALLNERSDKDPVALTANDDVTDLPPWFFGVIPDESGRPQNATPCVVILVEPEAGSGDADAFYFYFYSYDRGPNAKQVLPPLNGLLDGKIDPEMSFGDHVGDW